MFGLVYTPSPVGKSMAAITGSFFLTETVLIPNASVSGTRVTGTVDLSAYVNVPTGQAISISEVDFIWQVGSDYSGPIGQALGGNGALNAQLTDLNPGTGFILASDQSLVASQHIDVDIINNVTTSTQDLFPDRFGSSATSEQFTVVNDKMYLQIGNDAAAAADNLYCTVRIRAQVIKLSQKQWIALAIQSTASDN